MGPSFRRLLPFLARYRFRLSVGLLFVVTTTAIQLLPPWVLKYAVDDLTVGVTVAKLVRYALAVLGLACVGGVFRFLMRRVIIGASRDIEYDIRNAFFARLQQMPLGYYQARRTGDLMSRATNDLGAVRMMAGPAVMYAGQHGIRLRRRDPPDAVDRRAADADRARSAAVRVGDGPLLRHGDPRALREDPGAALRCQRDGAGERWPACGSCAPTGRNRRELARFRGANEEYVAATAR